MLLLKLANKIISKQSKSQRENMTDILIYKDLDEKYQNIRMTYQRDKIRFISHNVINNEESYNKKINLTITRVPVGININTDMWEPIHSGIGTPYVFRYRIEDGDREAIYNFKGLPSLISEDNKSPITSVMINNSKTGVWLNIECRDNKPRFIFFNFEKILIESVKGDE